MTAADDTRRRRKLLSAGARIAADIGRALFTLPAGGPVREPFEAQWCWADWTPGSGLPAYPSAGGYYCGLHGRYELAGLCNVHHAAIVGAAAEEAA